MIVTLGQRDDLNQDLNRIEGVYRSLGVEVLKIPSTTSDSIFHRDVAAWTPFGLIMARMGKPSRIWEPEVWFDYLDLTPTFRVDAPGTFEGADLVWLDDHRAVLAIGNRTNQNGANQILDWLVDQGAEVFTVRLPFNHDQHLLGIGNVLNSTLVTLENFRPGVGIPVLPADEYRGKGPNWVQVGEVVVLGRGCPQTVSILRAVGLTVVEVEIGNLLGNGGGVACTTGIVER